MKAVIISDTHNRHRNIILPDNGADMIIHAGDFSHSEKSMRDFLDWFASLDYKYKILVAGNHDAFAQDYNREFRYLCETLGIIYLEDSSIEIEDIIFYGSPWTPNFCNWSYMCSEEKLTGYYGMIPDNVKVLITHGPQLGVLDMVYGDRRVGSIALKKRIKELKELKLHVFGHIHESAGYEENEQYISINASSFDYYKKEMSKPYTIEIT